MGFALRSGFAPIFMAKGRTKGKAQYQFEVERRGIAGASHQAAKPVFKLER